eukprot:6793774-Pyramimonas_sp.AAC.1
MRLFTIDGVNEGVPHLSVDHFIYDSMHVLELGILHYVMGLTMISLITAGFFGRWRDKDHDEVDAAMTDSMKAWHARQGPHGPNIACKVHDGDEEGEGGGGGGGEGS